MIKILDLSGYLQWAGSFLIIVLVFFRFLKRPVESSIIGVYGIVSFVFQLFQVLNNDYSLTAYSASIGNTYVLFEATTLLLLYYFVFKDSKIKWFILAIAIIYVVFYFVIIIDQIMIMSSSIRALRDLIMIVCSFLYFFYLLKELPDESLIRIPMFWINSAILLFFSCTFMLSLFLGYIIEAMQGDLIAYWTFRNFLRVLFCGIICIGLWKARGQSAMQPKIGD